MATRQKSESGAYMSQYDTEVEKRLHALEAAVAALQSHSHDTAAASGGADPRVDVIVDWMNNTPALANEMPVHLDDDGEECGRYLDL